MVYQAKLLPRTWIDLQEAKKWYEEKRLGLGEEFKEEIFSQIEFIREHPKLYPKKENQVRSSYLKRFPYGIHYLVEEELQRIIIIGVIRVGRSPKQLQKRS